MRLRGSEYPETWGAKHWTHRTPDRVPRGERNGSAKLTAAQVRELRLAIAARAGSRARAVRDVATRLGVSAAAVDDAFTRRTWRWL